MEIGSEKWKDLIQTGARDFGIQLNPTQLDQFSAHAAELIQWTRRINLTAITDPLAVAVKHFLDSIATANSIPPDAVLLDIGSGGGFPGLPLKIVIPSLSVTLIDASHKKVSFMKHVIRSLKLVNIDALHTRAEELARSRTYGQAFDVIVSRALSDIDTFVCLSLPLLAKDGMMIALKGTPSPNEIQTLKRRFRSFQHGSRNRLQKPTITVKNYTLPYLGLKRSIFRIKIDEYRK